MAGQLLQAKVPGRARQEAEQAEKLAEVQAKKRREIEVVMQCKAEEEDFALHLRLLADALAADAFAADAPAADAGFDAAVAVAATAATAAAAAVNPALGA